MCIVQRRRHVYHLGPRKLQEEPDSLHRIACCAGKTRERISDTVYTCVCVKERSKLFFLSHSPGLLRPCHWPAAANRKCRPQGGLLGGTRSSRNLLLFFFFFFFFLTKSFSNYFFFYQGHDGMRIRELELCAQGGVSSLDIAYDGELFVAGSSDNVVRVSFICFLFFCFLFFCFFVFFFVLYYHNNILTPPVVNNRCAHTSAARLWPRAALTAAPSPRHALHPMVRSLSAPVWMAPSLSGR